jgi:hypothetical protein
VPTSMQISAADLAKLIKALPKYTPSILIRLEACQVGNISRAAEVHDKAFAQKLAAELPNPISAHSGDVAVITMTRYCEGKGHEYIFQGDKVTPKGAESRGPVSSEKGLGGGGGESGRRTFDAFGSTTFAAAEWESTWGNGGWLAIEGRAAPDRNHGE